MLSRRWMADFKRRFNGLKQSINELIIVDDAFGLRETKLALNQEDWSAATRSEQINRFKRWLGGQVAVKVLRAYGEEQWWRSYIIQAHVKGLGRAYDDVNRYAKTGNAAFYEGGKKRFLTDAFTKPVSVERVKVLVQRADTGFTGITGAMESQITRVLVDGLIAGTGPRELAKALNDRVDKIGISRANTLARTEIIRAHADGQLDALEALGVTEVGVMVEWTATKDSRTCPQCASLQNVVLSIEKARGLIPRHGNCRCAWIPAGVGEKDKNQIKGTNRIRAAIRRSLKAGEDKEWVGENLL